MEMRLCQSASVVGTSTADVNQEQNRKCNKL